MGILLLTKKHMSILNIFLDVTHVMMITSMYDLETKIKGEGQL